MKRIVVLGALLMLAFSFAIEQEISVPHTYIGNEAIACHPETAPQVTNGFATWFKDNEYACSHWNHKTQSQSDCFVALNGVCGMKQSYCDKCVTITNSNG